MSDSLETRTIVTPFRPRARLLQLLGDQLIGTPRLAVFELVKNAYDADSTIVSITLDKINTDQATITVEDDGTGMDFDTIRDIWLVPAHDHKKVQRNNLTRTKLQRLPLGEKGVGRFAVHKLGDEIELITKAAGKRECIVTINWNELIEKEFLSEAGVAIEEREVPSVFKHENTGTRITVKNLREKSWTRGEIRRLQRQITSICTPFHKRSDTFETILTVPEHPEWLDNIPSVEDLMKRAPWYFHFSFSTDATFNWEYQFKGVSGIKLEPRKADGIKEPLLLTPEKDLDHRGIEQGKKSSRSSKVVAGPEHTNGIGSVEGTFYVFDRDREILSRFGDAQLVQNFLDESGGIRIYRDGIRVYNYGEPGDDWLGLDLRRVNSPSRNISRNIIIGAIDIALESSAKLTEKTNREGFVETAEYQNLRQIILGALTVLETERKIDKDNIRILTANPRNPEVEKIAEPLAELRKIAEKHHITSEMEPLIEKAERSYNEMRDTMLRSGLSGVGLAIVFHEIERGVRILSAAADSNIEIKSIQVQARELVQILDGFSEILRKGDKRGNSLKDLIRRARDVNKVRFRVHNVQLICPFLEDTVPDINTSFAFGIMLGAINNILDNSFYWLKVRWPIENENSRQIYIDVKSDSSDGISIIIADNGPGFQDDPERLTLPFFSRRPNGIGVGLYYTNMVMELNSGRLLFPSNAEVEVPTEINGAILQLSFKDS